MPFGPRSLLSAGESQALPIGRGARPVRPSPAGSLESLRPEPEQSSKQFNAQLRQRYDAIASTVSNDYQGYTFASQFKLYAKDLKTKSKYRAPGLLNSDKFPALATERLLLLWQRKPSRSGLERVEQGLAKIDQLQAQLGPWNGLKRSEAGQALKAAAAPQKDNRNIKKKSDIEAWNDASQYVEALAAQRRVLLPQDLLEIEQRLLGWAAPRVFEWSKPQATRWSTQMLDGDDINFMYSFSEAGRKKLDPTDTFIPGASKKEMLKYFCTWFRKHRDAEHPVILAAQARQLLVSIHPFMDANGRLARQVANFVLMQAGYPPAYIPQEPDDKNTSVVLFPMKSFEDQISPDESLMLMVKGVLRAQRELLRNQQATVNG